ncbi:MAG TPA: hypothetical protein VGL46_09145 [Pseudonocardiaceae bacterium]|jgi:hypothetical protein
MTHADQIRRQPARDALPHEIHPPGGRAHRHNAPQVTSRQPHDQLMIIECDRCGDGPLVTGLPANTPIEKWPPALTRWLHNNGWRTNPEPRCGNHR